MHILFSTIVALCLILTNASNYDVQPFEVLTEASNAFSHKFFKINAPNYYRRNLISSELSIYIILSILARGANEMTKRKMHTDLCLPPVDFNIDKIFKNFIKHLNNLPNVNFKMANGMFVNSMFTVNQNYKNFINYVFQAELFFIDVHKPEEAVELINYWIQEKTNYTLENIINSREIIEDTKVILLNAVYFKSQWLNIFNETMDRNFYIDENFKICVPTMHVKAYFLYQHVKELGFKYIEIPYENEDIRMIIILPDAKDGLSQIESKITLITNTPLNLSSTLIDLYLPKFKIPNSFDLRQSLKEMDLFYIFETPDFTGITDPPLIVSKAKQKAYIEIDENGSKVSGVTLFGLMDRSSTSSEPEEIEVLVNRPFYFAIIVSKTVIFQGHVFDPSSET